jgi:MFS family permease
LGLLLCSLTLINVTTPIYFVAMFTFTFGFFLALQYTGMNSLSYAEISTENLSSSTSLMGTVQQVSQSFGVALAAFLLHYFSGSVNIKASLSISAFHHAFLAMGIVTFFSIFIFIQLTPMDGQQMIKKGVSEV